MKCAACVLVCLSPICCAARLVHACAACAALRDFCVLEPHLLHCAVYAHVLACVALPG